MYQKILTREAVMNQSKVAGFLILISFCLFSSCARFKAKRVDDRESDEKGLEITDKWLQHDTEKVVSEVVDQIEKHRGFRNYVAAQANNVPRVFVAEVQNLTGEPYFPIGDLNDELLVRMSNSGDFILVDAAARDSLLKEITYQNDGMVDPKTANAVGKQIGASLLIFGNVRMDPRHRDGRTLKQYSINLRMTDLEKGIEVVRTRAKISKYSEQRARGW